MDGNPVLLTRISIKESVELCIICQKKGTKSLSGGEKGRERLRRAAEQRNDEVFQRIQKLASESSFKYHMTNECYRSYTLEANIRRMANSTCPTDSNGNREDASVGTISNYHTRAKQTPRCISIESSDTTKITCIICGQFKVGCEVKKHRISERKRAQTLLDAAKLWNDQVFLRIIDLPSADQILEADLYYHAKCIRGYERNYERDQTKNDNANNNGNNVVEVVHQADRVEANDEDVIPGKDKVVRDNAIFSCIKNIEPRFLAGEAFSLTDLRLQVTKDLDCRTIEVENRHVKTNLLNYFGDLIRFSIPREANKPTMFFSSTLSQEELVDKIRSHSTVEDCATQIKEALTEVDFGLDDKYCDEYHLKQSWNNMKIPDTLKRFFATIFSIDETYLEDNPTEIFETGSDTDSTSRYFEMKALKIKSLFQMFYYIVNNGRKITPLHVITGLSVHNSSKSKSLVTCLNRTGISISYDEVQRYRTGLALQTAQAYKNGRPLPRNFDAKNFTTAAFDNFDHEEATLSGLNGTHDTVSVLFQDSSNSCDQGVLDMSYPEVTHSDRAFNEPLECQTLRNFERPTKTVALPGSYRVKTADSSITPKDYLTNMHSVDLAWFLSRMDLSDSMEALSTDSVLEQQIPSWSAFNSVVKKDDRPKQIVGFLPILPHPVTDYATVYTAMCNFKDILQQLDQKFLPVACDEGVYKLARHIKLIREEEMKPIILFLGGFHIAKVVFGCIGRFLKGSGVENIFIETGLFGVNITEQVLKGTHYVRSVKGLYMFAEALTRLQLQAFLTKDKLEKYGEEIATLNALKGALIEQSFDECKVIIEHFNQCSKELIADFHDFVKNRSEESRLFKYWSVVLALIALARDLIRADREGNWELHIETLKKLQPLFHVMDRVNYARWSSVYLEDMLRLEYDAPEVFHKFVEGRFTVKQSSTPFTSVATDQALEQTINRSSKSSAGIIGSTKKKNYVAAWDMIYHEILAINSFYKTITFVENDNTELKIHHEFTTSRTDETERSVMKILQYIEEHVNPFMPGNQPLRDIVTEQLVDSTTTESLLNIFETGCAQYERFRHERFVTKSTPISAVIRRTNLPSFKNSLSVKPPKTTKKVQKSNQECQRILELARERNYSVKQLLTYELVSETYLFDDAGCMKKEGNKSQLAHELEKFLPKGQTFEVAFEPMYIVIDVMLVCRSLRWKDLKNFGDFAVAFCRYVSVVATSRGTTRIDFVFDTYFEVSPKSFERIRRYDRECIMLHKIDEDIALPTQENKFWSSTQNKVLLQSFLRQYISNHGLSIWPGIEIILSSTDREECTSTSVSRAKSTLSILQRVDIEEADVRIIIHIAHATYEGEKKAFILSSDTDVLVLAINFWKTFRASGLQELWMRIGSGATKRNVPVHIIATSLDEKDSSSVVALHHLTGSDYTSKVGTKLSGLRSTPGEYLADFGRHSAEAFVDSEVTKAEEYLVQVLRRDKSCKTFDDLRYHLYHHSKCMGIRDLPPTSASIKLHILRAYYVTYEQLTCLDKHSPKLDPNLFGYVLDDDALVPLRVSIFLPPSHELVPNCHCKTCSRKTCCCVAAKVQCCSFCACQKEMSCKNVCKK